jgi:hypothetical protein
MIAREDLDGDAGGAQPLARRPVAIESDDALAGRPLGRGGQELDRALGPALTEIGGDMHDRNHGTTGIME